MIAPERLGLSPMSKRIQKEKTKRKKATNVIHHLSAFFITYFIYAVFYIVTFGS